MQYQINGNGNINGNGAAVVGQGINDIFPLLVGDNTNKLTILNSQ